MSIILKASHIDKNYRKEPVIRDISLEVARGETLAIIGHSGVGKTTLFNILSGLDLPDRGKVVYRDQEITGKSGFIGYMQQKDLLLEHKTLMKNLIFPLKIKGFSREEAETLVSDCLEEFGLAGCGTLYPQQMSGGMRQRAALLRTFLYSRELLLLDEPFSALDEITRSGLHRWYRKIADTYQTSSILITHSIDEALILADRICIMKGKPGEIREVLPIDRQNLSAEEFQLNKIFLEYKKSIINSLKKD